MGGATSHSMNVHNASGKCRTTTATVVLLPNEQHFIFPYPTSDASVMALFPICIQRKVQKNERHAELGLGFPMDLPNVHGGKTTGKSLLQKFLQGIHSVAIAEKLRKLSLLHVPPQEIFLSEDILFTN